MKYADKEILKKLIVDRNHIAHARRPYHLGQNPGLVRSYFIEASKVLIARQMSRRGDLLESTEIIADYMTQ